MRRRVSPRAGLRLSLVVEYEAEAVAKRARIELGRCRQWRKHHLDRSRARYCARVALARIGPGGPDDPANRGIGHWRLMEVDPLLLRAEPESRAPSSAYLGAYPIPWELAFSFHLVQSCEPAGTICIDGQAGVFATFAANTLY